VWKSSWSSVELEKLRLRLTEFHGLSRRERFLMVLAVGTGHCKDESEAHRLAKAGALESMPLTTSHNNRGVLDTLTRFVADDAAESERLEIEFLDDQRMRLQLIIENIFTIERLEVFAQSNEKLHLMTLAAESP
jgi:hypothetical protein